jgi:hypothetical protein
MKKLLLLLVFVAMAAFNVSAQFECNQNYSNFLDADGEAELPIIDLVPNIEFMLTQGEVTYYVYPFATGTVNSASDVIQLTCENRGLPTFIVELTSGGDLLDNCFGTLIITSPNGGCPGDNPDICGENPDCLKLLSGYFIADETVAEIFATDIALCENALGCNGNYSIAYGLASDGPSLSFSNSISSADATQYKNPITIFYTDASTTVFLQSYLYVWANAECILKATYRPFYELDLTEEAQITPDNFMVGEIQCDQVGLALTGINDPEPISYSTSITVNCDHLGQRKVWVRNLLTGYTVPKVIEIRDPLEACGTVLGPGDRLVNYTKGIQGLFFGTEIEVNGILLPRHPGGIGWILNENDLLDGQNTLNFNSSYQALNGVSTLDIVLGQKIILFDEYDHPRESVLFDVDQSGYNGINDLITMREIILGINDGMDLPYAYFFNNSYTFPSNFNPFDFENTFTEFTFDKDDFETVDLSFEAYKVGDLNETAAPGFKAEKTTETRSAGPAYLVTDMIVEVGQEFTFELKYESEIKFKGLLAALIGDGLKFTELEHTSPQVNFNIINDNEIRILYGNPNAIAELDEITFTITAIASKAGELVDLLGLKSGFPQEIVGEGNIVIPVEDLGIITISSVNIEGVDSQINVFPNPANNNVTLSSENAELKNVIIIDAIGRTVMTRNLSSNKETLDIVNLANGLYHIKITTESGVQAATFIKE